MTQGETVALIPVRGGSKSIPLKNIRPIAGRPLVHWTIEAALACPGIDRVCVSTDSEAIRDALTPFAGQTRFEIVGRAAETATDTASTESAMLEFAQGRSFETLVLIQATSPLLTARDLTRGLDLYRSGAFDSLLSVARQKRFLWETGEGGVGRPVNYDPARRPRRQEFAGHLAENGAFYVTGRAALLASGCRLSGRIGLLEMDEATYLELDEPHDWAAIEQLLLARSHATADDAPARRIKLIATDVDGVLTDAGMYYSEQGDELKKFSTRDGMGLGLARRAGLATAILTSEQTALVARRAAKLKIDHLRQGVTDKLACMMALTDELGLALDEVCYVGDDLNDAPLLRAVGLGCCPADADERIRAACRWITRRRGGEGVVREVIDRLLAARGIAYDAHQPDTVVQ